VSAGTAKHTHHAIDYIEFTAPDLLIAKVFYQTVFGWRFNDYGPDYCGIQHPTQPGLEVGGFARNDEAARASNPLVILYSDDLEATLDKVTRAGGQIAQPIFEFPGGRRFHFTDPSGNLLGVWTPNSG
jgi:predicted enzyme related to lactoylglutathione lyase